MLHFCTARCRNNSGAAFIRRGKCGQCNRQTGTMHAVGTDGLLYCSHTCRPLNVLSLKVEELRKEALLSTYLKEHEAKVMTADEVAAAAEAAIA